MKIKIDQTDCGIIELLQKDGRTPNTIIAKQLNISEATVRSRLNRLVKEDYIQIVAVSNPLKLGFRIVGTVKVKADLKKLDHVSKELSKIHQLWYIAKVSGEYDFEAEFNAKSMDDLNSFLSEKVNMIEGVNSVATTLVLNFVKRRYDWKTAMNDTKDL